MPSKETRSLAELFEVVHRHIYGFDRREGLTSIQWSCLRYFARATQDQCTVGAYGRAFQVATSSATRMIAGLVEKRHLKVSRPRGPRSSHVDLTAKGHEVLTRDPLLPLGRAIDRLPESQRAAMRTGLNTLLRESVMLDSGITEDVDQPPTSTSRKPHKPPARSLKAAKASRGR